MTVWKNMARVRAVSLVLWSKMVVLYTFFYYSLKAILHEAVFFLSGGYFITLIVHLCICHTASVYAANVKLHISPLSSLSAYVIQHQQCVTMVQWRKSDSSITSLWFKYSISNHFLSSCMFPNSDYTADWIYNTESRPRCLCFIDRGVYPHCWAERGSAKWIINPSLMVRNHKTLSSCCTSTFTAAVFFAYVLLLFSVVELWMSAMKVL